MVRLTWASTTGVCDYVRQRENRLFLIAVFERTRIYYDYNSDYVRKSSVLCSRTWLQSNKNSFPCQFRLEKE